MAQVSVSIDGKAYRMACEEGQEDHLTELANGFDQYVSHLKSQFGEIGDLRLTVMAAIMVMDELSELKRKVRGQDMEAESLKKTRDAALARAEAADKQLAETLDQVAGKIEGVTQQLNAN